MRRREKEDAESRKTLHDKLKEAVQVIYLSPKQNEAVASGMTSSSSRFAKRFQINFSRASMDGDVSDTGYDPLYDDHVDPGIDEYSHFHGEEKRGMSGLLNRADESFEALSSNRGDHHRYKIDNSHRTSEKNTGIDPDTEKFARGKFGPVPTAFGGSRKDMFFIAELQVKAAPLESELLREQENGVVLIDSGKELSYHFSSQLQVSETSLQE